MDFQEIIALKQRGKALTADQIGWLVDGFATDRLPAYQMAAFLMATWFQGMNAAETVALTGSMLHSGAVLDLGSLSGPTADKHSTGGVGDKVSLLLAPLAAACGIQVPMLSGRGLGHTGGTLDKLEAIPGYQILLPNQRFVEVVAEVGCAIVGQSEDIAPADGKIYALRDVTGTVDCIPLITASILSKKIAAGPASLVIDLKTGSGAFMDDMQRAHDLARALVDTAAHWERPLSVVFSDMSQPLGCAVGHASETIEAFAALRPAGRSQAPPDLVELTTELVVEMILLTGACSEAANARDLVRAAWDSGKAFNCLQRWVTAQGGRLELERDDFGLTVAPVAAEVTADRVGHVNEVRCREIGYSLADLGGARRRVDTDIDLTAGIDFLVRIGDPVLPGQPLARIHCRDADRAAVARRRLAAAVTISESPAPAVPLIRDRLRSA